MTTPADDLPSTRPWFTTYRVSWWRAGWAEPRRVEFGLLADAERYVRQAMLYVDSKEGGPVVRVELAERLTTSWTVIDRRDLPRGHGAGDAGGR